MGQNSVGTGQNVASEGRWLEYKYQPDRPTPLFDRYNCSYLHPSPSATAEHCITYWSNVAIPDEIISQTEEAYRSDREQEIDDDMNAALAVWTDDWASKNPEGKKTARSTDERNAKYRAEHEAYRLSILPGVEAERPLAMGEYDSRQLIRTYQMVANRPNPDKFPEESEKVLNHEMQLFDETATIREIHLKYQLHRVGGNIKDQVKVDEGQAVLDAIGQTNIMLAGINQEIVRQDLARNY